MLSTSGTPEFFSGFLRAVLILNPPQNTETLKCEPSSQVLLNSDYKLSYHLNFMLSAALRTLYLDSSDHFSND
jgi:hypothetical protein